MTDFIESGDPQAMRAKSYPIATSLYACFGLFALSSACNGESELESRSYIAPLDGQTAWPLDLPLQVKSSEIEVPPDYDAPPTLRVYDLTTGGEIEGTVLSEDTGLTFVPHRDWLPRRRYIWNLDPVTSVPHGPDLSVPLDLDGVATFETDDPLKLLAGGVDESDRMCLVFSRVILPQDGGCCDITINDIALEEPFFEILSQSSIGEPYPLLAGDTGVDIICVSSDTPIAAGASLRLWWGDEGPWKIDLQAATANDLIVGLRRGNW